MKAKTLANNFKADGFTTNSLSEILLSLRSNIGELMKQRNPSPSNPRAVIAVFDEVNAKWKSFVKRVNAMSEFKGCLKDDLLMEALRELDPDTFSRLDGLREHVK